MKSTTHEPPTKANDFAGFTQVAITEETPLMYRVDAKEQQSFWILKSRLDDDAKPSSVKRRKRRKTKGKTVKTNDAHKDAWDDCTESDDSTGSE
jgi:hypothetical protein